MATLIDVARRAGVSTASVSRVLSGSTSVSETMRGRVLAAVQESGFQLNPLAQGLRKGRGNTVALLVGDIEQGLYATLTRHLQIALGEIGADLMLYDLRHSAERLMHMLQRAEAMRLRGIAIATTDMIPLPQVRPLLLALVRSGMPVVSLGQTIEVRGVTSIVHEERTAAARAAAYLLDRWGGPIAYVGRIAGSATGTERYRGFRDAVARAGIAPEAAPFWDASFRYAAGHDTLAAALRQGIRPRCVLAGSDEIALGALGAVQDHGLRVPEDVAVMGFGNLAWGAHVRPALSTVSAQPEQVAARVRDVLAGQKIADPAPLARTLVLRQSA